MEGSYATYVAYLYGVLAGSGKVRLSHVRQPKLREPETSLYRL